MRDVYVVAVGMIPFGRHFNLGVKQLTGWALKELFANSPVDKKEMQAAWFSNTAWGRLPYEQHCIRGQVALGPSGITDIPIMNVENACASGSCAVHGAFLGVAAGMYDVALTVGVEKMAVPKKMPDEELPEFYKTMARNQGKTPQEMMKAVARGAAGGFMAGTDIEATQSMMADIREQAEKERAKRQAETGEKKKSREKRSPFMDLYSSAARNHMKRYGLTQEQLAIVAAKSHNNGALNPNAQYRFTMTPQQVLDDDDVSYPLTRAMCAPIGDGAAAAILVSGDYLEKLTGARPVKIRGTALGSGSNTLSGNARAKALAEEVYNRAGVAPQDIDVAEVHDATAFGEIAQAENLGFCEKGEGGRLAESGATALGGKIPINTSGGLLSRGHPVGASGIAMLAECFYQLRGEAGERQVDGARLAMVENGGGWFGTGEASMVMTILEGPPNK